MRADRLLAVLLLLQRHGRMTARALATELEVCERTIYRDLDALSTAGVPIYVERGRQGGCRLMEGYRTDLTGLTLAEVRTLVAARAVGHLADLGLDAAGDAALLKLLAALPEAHRALAERVLARTYLDAAGWFQAAEEAPLLGVVQEGVWQDRRLHLTYRRSSGAVTEGVVDPLGLVAKGTAWYLVAREGESMRVFRVARIQEAALLAEQVARPPSFDLRDFWAAWCREFAASIPRYAVTLRVHPAVAEQVASLLGADLRLHRWEPAPPDHAGWRLLHAEFERLADARRALLGCGPWIEAVAPPELRASLREESAARAALYA
jgi:predicted DNA-binding transcriptional regulator YafY